MPKVMEANVKTRLEEYIKVARYTSSEFGRRIGVSSSYIASIRRSISPSKIVAIRREFPDLNINWLLTGEGDMLNTPEPIPVPQPTEVSVPAEAWQVITQQANALQAMADAFTELKKNAQAAEGSDVTNVG